MYVVSVSGQHLGLSFISAFSGTPLAGLSGLISGYKSIDGAAQAGISGYVTELAFGQYQANLYDFDVSGKIATFYFTGASGAIPVEKTVVTTLNVSGQIYPASGINTLVPISSISGVIVNSGLFVSVPIATISGAIANSGLFVTVPIATISGVIANSGLFVVTTVSSGTVYLASGSLFKTIFASGVLGTSGGLPTSWGGSGAVTDGQNLDKSGYTLTSGLSYPASGINAVVPPVTLSGVVANSGLFVSVPIATLSGVVANSGLFVSVPIATLSGVQPISGATVSVPIASISGAIANSGLFVSVPIATISGVQPISGATVTVPIASISGVNAVVPPATLSGVVANSGLFVNATASVASGTLYLASGSIFTTTFASGVLAQSGEVYLASGTFLAGSGQFFIGSGTTFQATIASGSLSGQPIAGLSGYIYPASGINVTATATVGSGLFVSVPISSISGVNVVATATVTSGTLYLASGSIFKSTFASGVLGASGGLPLVWGNSGAVSVGQNLDKSGYALTSGLSYTASGIYVNAANVSVSSGQVYLNSGWPAALKTYDNSGLPNTPVHTMVNAERKLVDKWDLSSASGYLTVFLEDALGIAYQQPLTAQSGAAPVTSLGDA